MGRQFGGESAAAADEIIDKTHTPLQTDQASSLPGFPAQSHHTPLLICPSPATPHALWVEASLCHACLLPGEM